METIDIAQPEKIVLNKEQKKQLDKIVTRITGTKKKKPKAKPAPPVFVKNKAFNRKALIKAMIDTRIERGQTLDIASKKAGLSKSSFQQVEAIGNCKPDVLVKICNWLEVPVQQFFS